MSTAPEHPHSWTPPSHRPRSRNCGPHGPPSHWTLWPPSTQRFLRQWALQIAIERHPDLAARLRHLEARAAHVTDPEDGRMIAAEIGRILDKAAAEAGYR
ncbi:hypothetical protein [Streptomyces virginiae]|uniref:hypothetical protein n=1 Tax=Streptomyces virginiae TaxID=1961 RepID=UPI003450318C